MSDIAIKLEGVGKMYKVFASRKDHLADALALSRVLPRFKADYREFWALRGIDLELRKGDRLGVVGRNGAGKSTLLRLITGNVPLSEGRLNVHGEVQALIEAGGGFHPEFTGRENIAAALLYQGHAPSELKRTEAEIAEFTELEEFLDQPFKTFSLGMQARLTFAVATAVRPEILIVDEMLGAGDAYFMAKCTERMRQLVDGGAAVLLVSHSLDHVMMFCDTAIWLDRGRIVARGPSMEVCKAYEKFIRELDDKRLRAKNQKVRSGAYSSIQYDNYADACMVRFTARTGSRLRLDVSAVALRRDAEAEDEVLVGEAQDADAGQSGRVILDGSAWSSPRHEGDQRYRSVTARGTDAAVGAVAFSLYALYPESTYEFVIRYRLLGEESTTVEVLANGAIRNVIELPPTSGSGWETRVVSLTPAVQSEPASDKDLGAPVGKVSEEGEGQALEMVPATVVSRWPGKRWLVIEKVQLLDGANREQAVYEVGTRLVLRMAFLAELAGSFPLTVAAVLFRRDGVLVARYIGQPITLDLESGEKVTMELDLGTLKFGNGHYVFSVALYRSLDVHHRSEPEAYDLLDRSFEFEVFGTPPLLTGVVIDGASWELVGSHAIRASTDKAVG